MAIANLGGMLGALMPPKLNRITYSSDLDKALNATTAGLGAYRTAQDADLGRLTDELGRATQNLRGLEGQDQSILGQLIGQNQVDPMNTYREIGAYQTGVLDKLAKDLSGMGRSQDNALMARFGLGGRSGGTYQTNSIVDRLSKNLAPYYAQTLGNLGRDTGIVTGARTEGVGNVLDLINARAGVPMRTVGIQALPSQQRTQNLQSEIAALLGLGEGYRGNTAGFKEEKNKWAAFADAADEGINSALDTAMSLYSGGMTGGMFGGGGRSGGGGQSGGGFFPTSGYGMNRGGGNNQAVLQLLSQLLGL